MQKMRKIERMYEEINDLIDKTRAEDNVIIMGDMNATVGEGRDGIAVGEFGLGVRNERGDMLVEFCTRNNLIITNTQFNHHKRRTLHLESSWRCEKGSD